MYVICTVATSIHIYSQTYIVIQIFGSALQLVKLETKQNERHRRQPLVGFPYQLKKCMYRIPLICIGKIEAKINMGEGGWKG